MDTSLIAVLVILISSSIYFIRRGNLDFNKLKEIERKIEKDTIRAKECRQEFKIKKAAIFEETSTIGQFELYNIEVNVEIGKKQPLLSRFLFQNEEVLS